MILSGPSGVGKDTVLSAWSAVNPRVVRVVAYTTRAMRSGEQEGVDYHFVDADQFHQMAERGEFLEHKLVHGNYYATPLTDMERLLAEGKIAVLKIDVQGALSAMELRPEAITIFLEPPTFAELEERIRGRATDDEATILKRLEGAREELAFASRYRHRVVNRDVAHTVAELESLLAPAVMTP